MIRPSRPCNLPAKGMTERAELLYSLTMPATASPSRLDDELDGIFVELGASGNLDDVIPQLARDRQSMQRIESLVRRLPTTHNLILGDARSASALPPESIHLVVTSPPYWGLRDYGTAKWEGGDAVCDRDDP